MKEEKPKVKKKRGIVKKIFLGILLIIVLVIVFFLLRSVILNFKDKRFTKNLSKIREEETIKVIVDINPSFAFVVKNDTVIESYCLNEDCVELLNKMNINYDDNLNNKKLEDVINNIYDGAKANGYNTDNGVKVSSSSPKVEALIKNVNDASFNYLTKEHEEELLKDKNIKIDKEEYNNKLLSELKKDSDYDKTYTCKIENDEVKCYMLDFMIKFKDIKNPLTDITRVYTDYDKFKRLLDKFDISYSFVTIGGEPDKTITLADGIPLGYGDECYDSNNEATMKKVYYCLMGDINNRSAVVSFLNVDLLSKTYEEKDIIYYPESKF